MQSIDKEHIDHIKADFAMRWNVKIQSLVQLRRTKMSQSDMAYLSGRSIKTIQRFENYKVFDPELMYIYKNTL